METASVVRYTNPRQANLFGNAKFVLHKIDSKPQAPKARREFRNELESLSCRYRVREVHTHNDPILDVLDVIEYLADASRSLKPSADPQHKKRSLKECLDFLCQARAEMDDAIEVVCEALETEGENWRDMPCMQESPRPIYSEII